MIELLKIRIDGDTQSRAELNQDTVAEYAEAMRAGTRFPPVAVFYDGADYWLADGFHRYFGAKQAGIEAIAEEVHPGTKLDAQLYSFGANATNGLRRSNADKRKAVTGALKHPTSKAWSDNQIAKHCGVSDHLVSDVRKSIFEILEDSSSRTVTRNGTTYKQDTSKIGKSRKKSSKEEEAPSDEPFGAPEDYAPDDEEIRQSIAENAEYQKSIERIMAADDKLSAANEEIKRQRFIITGLEARLAGEQRKSADAIRKMKYWRDMARKPGGVVA